MLARLVAAVVQAPQLGALVLRIPLAELVAEAVHALLRPGLLLVAPGTAEHCVEAVGLDRVEQGRGLQPVPRRTGTLVLDDAAAVDRILHRGDHQAGAELRDTAVAVVEHLLEVVAGVHVHEGERDLRGVERLLGDAEHDDRVLAAAEQEARALELCSHLAHDVDRLGLDGIEVC